MLGCVVSFSLVVGLFLVLGCVMFRLWMSCWFFLVGLFLCVGVSGGGLFFGGCSRVSDFFLCCGGCVMFLNSVVCGCFLCGSFSGVGLLNVSH